MIRKGDTGFVLAMLDYRKHIIASYHAMDTTGKNGGDPLFDVRFELGSKYIRVVTQNYNSRSAHSFIEKENGVIWKSASWKAPAKNFSRGTILDPSTWNNIHWYGL